MNIIELAMTAGFAPCKNSLYACTQTELQAFANLVIEAHTQELIGVGVEPDISYDGEHWYTKDQLAAAVLRERQRGAKVCDEICTSIRNSMRSNGGSDGQAD